MEEESELSLAVAEALEGWSLLTAWKSKLNS